MQFETSETRVTETLKTTKNQVDRKYGKKNTATDAAIFNVTRTSLCSNRKGHVVVVITKPDTLLLFCGLGTHLLYFYGIVG